MHGVIIVAALFVWLIRLCKHLDWLVALPNLLYHLPDSWWCTHRWWILRPFLIPWRMLLFGRILLVGIGVWSGVPLLSTGLLSFRDKCVGVYTLSLYEVRWILTLSALIPHMSCHCESVGKLPLDDLTFSKKFSKWMCNSEETNPLLRFSIKATYDVCLGEGSRLIPIISLDSHLGCSPPDLKLFLSAYAGHPRVWWYLILGDTCTWEYISTGKVALSLSGNMFLV